MRRRDFTKLIPGLAVAWPLLAGAQQSAMPVIGFMNIGTLEEQAGPWAAFRQGLSETGYIEKQKQVCRGGTRPHASPARRKRF
jgi:putative ABC transport system substrate-binding protein